MSTQAFVTGPAQPLLSGHNRGGDKGDRFGVVLSVFCAIHCAVTPILLLASPAIGKIWSHPASHWLVALLVIPLAVVMVHKGYRSHRRKWVIASGAVGILLILVGAAAPSFGNISRAGTAEISNLPTPAMGSADASESCPGSECATGCGNGAETQPSAHAGVEPSGAGSGESLDPDCTSECVNGSAVLASDDAGSGPGSESSAMTAELTCVDACCPSILAEEDGGWRLQVPLASVLTTLGGLFLIATHIGNLRRCPTC